MQEPEAGLWEGEELCAGEARAQHGATQISLPRAPQRGHDDSEVNQKADKLTASCSFKFLSNQIIQTQVDSLNPQK